MIAIDWTLSVSAFIFLVTLVGLNRLLFRPLFEVLEQRKAATSDVFDRAEGGQDIYELKVAEYEGRLKAERQAGYQQAETLRSEGLQQQQSRVTEARSKAEALIAESREKVEEELNQARDQLRQDARAIALSISERILSR